MHFVVGSLSQKKQDNIKKVVSTLLKNTTFTITTYDAHSQVPTTPWDQETLEGARNRALDCKQNSKGDYFVGLESGIIERYDIIFEEAWCCILDKNDQEYYGYSSGLKVPDIILEEMKNKDLPHYKVINQLREKYKIQTEGNNTWGFYSAEMIARDISLEEAVRNACIQVFASDTSLYKLSFNAFHALK